MCDRQPHEADDDRHIDCARAFSTLATPAAAPLPVELTTRSSGEVIPSLD
jgi:hypothetical protein